MDIPEIIVESNMFQKIGNEGTVMQIERRITIPGVEDQELQQRLVHVAESCPVSKILKGAIKITSEFGTAGTVIDETETTPIKTDQEIN